MSFKNWGVEIGGYSAAELRWMTKTYPEVFKSLKRKHDAYHNFAPVTSQEQQEAAQAIVNGIAKQMQDMATVMKAPAQEVANLLRQLLILKWEEHFIFEDEILAHTEPFLVIPRRLGGANEGLVRYAC